MPCSTAMSVQGFGAPGRQCSGDVLQQQRWFLLFLPCAQLQFLVKSAGVGAEPSPESIPIFGSTSLPHSGSSSEQGVPPPPGRLLPPPRAFLPLLSKFPFLLTGLLPSPVPLQSRGGSGREKGGRALGFRGRAEASYRRPRASGRQRCVARAGGGSGRSKWRTGARAAALGRACRRRLGVAQGGARCWATQAGASRRQGKASGWEVEERYDRRGLLVIDPRRVRGWVAQGKG